MIRTGIGFDTHRFAKKRRLVIGGVEIPHSLGLQGHSDADVLTHAVMDALLGAIAEGDIGTHFPSSDPKWKDADSLELLNHVTLILRKRKTRIVNIDSTIVAEVPKLAPHFDQMRRNIARAAGVKPGAVSVKATTPEKMGALGRKEGISAMAVATVRMAGA